MRYSVPIAAALLLAAPATADLKIYSLDGDQSNFIQGLGTVVRADVIEGQAAIEEGALGPVLVDLDLRVVFTDVIAATPLTGIPGSTMYLDNLEVLGPSLGLGQAGIGSTSTVIEWGTLAGWTSSGRLVCTTGLPFGTPPPSACTPLFGFEGTVPLIPLASNSFDTGPWIFTEGGFRFGPTASVRFSDDGFGTQTQNLSFGGSLALGVPGLPIAGIGALAAALLALGMGMLRRRNL